MRRRLPVDERRRVQAIGFVEMVVLIRAFAEDEER
jgi:hypothetical protein